MKRRSLQVICMAGILALSGACLAARLNNGFDLKGPRGLVGYLGALLSPTFPPCSFDQGNFDQCSFSP
jgi:hypothetical protein